MLRWGCGRALRGALNGARLPVFPDGQALETIPSFQRLQNGAQPVNRRGLPIPGQRADFEIVDHASPPPETPLNLNPAGRQLDPLAQNGKPKPQAEKTEQGNHQPHVHGHSDREINDNDDSQGQSAPFTVKPLPSASSAIRPIFVLSSVISWPRSLGLAASKCFRSQSALPASGL